jgi:hypothetical protein
MRLSSGPEKLVRGADVDPVFISGHDDPMLPIVSIDAQAYRFVEIFVKSRAGAAGARSSPISIGHDSGKARRKGVRRPWVDRIGGHFEALTSAG